MFSGQSISWGRIVGQIANHDPPSFKLVIDGSVLKQMHVLQDLLDVAFKEHLSRCTCRYAESRTLLSTEVWICKHGTQSDGQETMDMFVANDPPPVDRLSGKSALHFIVNFQKIDKRARSISPATVRLDELGKHVFRVVGPKMIRTSLGTGDWYKDVAMSGTTVFDITQSLGSCQQGSLLCTESRVCLLFATPSPYMALLVSSLLSFYHDIARVNEYEAFCSPLSMVRMAKASGISISPSTHACVTFDFGKWPEPLTTIPDSFSMPAVPETLDAFHKAFMLQVRRSIYAFRASYRGILDFPADFQLIKANKVITEFLLWIHKHAPHVKLFVIVRDLQKVLSRPFCASLWEGCEPGSVTDKRATVSRWLLEPIRQSYLAEDGVVRKVLFVGPYLPDWLQAGFAPDGTENLINLCDFASVRGLTQSHVQRGFKSVSRDHMASCHLTGYVTAGTVNIRMISPESAQAAADCLNDGQAKDAQGRPLDASGKIKAMHKDFASQHFESAAKVIFPLLLGQDDARRALTDLLRPETRVPASDIITFPTQLTTSKLVAGHPARRLFYTRCLMLGLLVRDGVSANYRLSGMCAKELLQRISTEVNFNYRRRFLYRLPTRREQDRKRSLKFIDPRDTQMLNLADLTEQALATLILNYYRPPSANAHPHDQPRDEHTFQAEFVHLLRASTLSNTPPDAPRNYVNDVQTEVWARALEKTEPALNRPDVEKTELVLKRPDVFLLVRLADGTFKLYIFELKFFNPSNTVSATHEHKPGLASSREDQWVDRYQQFLLELNSIPNLPAKWFRDPSRGMILLPIAFGLGDIRCVFVLEPPRRSGTAAQSQPATVQPKKTDTKQPIDVASGGCVQVSKYGDAIVQGVKDAVQVTSNAKLGPGVADWRVTDMGPGSTEIVPIVIVNVAGTLVYVNKLPSRKLDRKLAFVNAYPWNPDRTEKQNDAILDAINFYKPPTD